MIDSIQGIILDMDGVLWRDQTPIGDLPAIFSEIRRRNWSFVLATNNATLSADMYVDKLRRFGVFVERSQIINTSQATADYMIQKHPMGGPVYLIGEQGLKIELSAKGFYESDQSPLAVIVGLDRNITYEKLKKAGLLVRSGVPFVATNLDKTYPTPEGLVPGAGVFVGAVRDASDVQPVVIGKPEPEMYRIALARMGLEPERVLVVGDRLETDIVGAQRLNCHTAVVLSGVSTADQAYAWQPKPDCIADNLTALLELNNKASS